LPINPGEPAPLRHAIQKGAVRKPALEELRAQQPRAGRHLPAPHRGQIHHRPARLPLVTAAQNADSYRRALTPGSRQRADAEQFRIVRMGHDGQDAFVREIEFHKVEE
jgi:hypothetical protein